MRIQPRIILIDDDRLWAETLADYLRSKGYRVQTAADGATGLALLDHHDVALALVDGHLPDMEGLDVLRHLRRHRHRPAVVMVSGDDEPTLKNRALAEGAAAFLSKTVSPRLLLRAVHQILDGPAWKRWLPVPVRFSRYLPVPVSFGSRSPSRVNGTPSAS